jgi:protein arginine N-methyltransferase 1
MSIQYYRRLLAQPLRLRAMHEAIERTVKEGDVVIEIGTGLGTYAIWAARAGAEQVYAVEPARVAEVAHEVIAASGVGDRIRLLHGRVEEVELPGDADVLITEDFAPWFFDSHLHDILLYVRSDVLAEGGRIIPGRVTLQAAPWGGPPPDDVSDLHQQIWQHRAGSGDLEMSDLEGIDFSTRAELFFNEPDPNGVPAAGILARPGELFSWDLTVLDPGVHHARIEWKADRSGYVWGIGVWADFELAPGITYSNAPGEPETSWRQGHFPVDPPMEVDVGTSLSGDIEARSDPNGEVWWRWRLQETGARGTLREGNTFRSIPLDRARLTAISEQGRIPLNRWAVVDAYLLGALAEYSLEEAVGRTLDAFSDPTLDVPLLRRRAARLREPYIASREPQETDSSI